MSSNIKKKMGSEGGGKFSGFGGDLFLRAANILIGRGNLAGGEGKKRQLPLKKDEGGVPCLEKDSSEKTNQKIEKAGAKKEKSTDMGKKVTRVQKANRRKKVFRKNFN